MCSKSFRIFYVRFSTPNINCDISSDSSLFSILDTISGHIKIFNLSMENLGNKVLHRARNKKSAYTNSRCNETREENSQLRNLSSGNIQQKSKLNFIDCFSFNTFYGIFSEFQAKKTYKIREFEIESNGIRYILKRNWLNFEENVFFHQVYASCIFLLSNKYFFLAGSQHDRNILKPNFDFLVEKYYSMNEQEETAHVTAICVKSYNFRGQLFDTVYFENLVEQNEKVQLFFDTTGYSDILEINSANIRLNSIKSFADSIRFDNCKILPFLNDDKELIVQNYDSQYEHYLKLSFLHCEFSLDTCFMQQDHIIELSDCRFSDVVNFENTKNIELSGDSEDILNTSFILQGLCFKVSTLSIPSNSTYDFEFKKSTSYLSITNLDVRSWFEVQIQLKFCQIENVTFDDEQDKEEIFKSSRRQGNVFHKKESIDLFKFDCKLITDMNVLSSFGTLFIVNLGNLPDFHIKLERISRFSIIDGFIALNEVSLIHNGNEKYIESFEGPIQEFKRTYTPRENNSRVLKWIKFIFSFN